jgi:hypothetical protein
LEHLHEYSRVSCCAASVHQTQKPTPRLRAYRFAVIGGRAVGAEYAASVIFRSTPIGLERTVQTSDVNGEVALLGAGDGGRRKGNEEDVLTHCEVSDCEREN